MMAVTRWSGETPPRTWGRLFTMPSEQMNGRNTPTHVGKTPIEDDLRGGERKHPHARGEDSSVRLTTGPWSETPPRTWGRLVAEVPHVAGVGNTPTHVGKTAGRACLSVGCRKHPHARGEDRGVNRQQSDRRETPPRTWGRPLVLDVRGRELGNTPTHVGKTLHVPCGYTQTGKHPHARGEDYVSKVLPRAPPETPPRTWGRRGSAFPAGMVWRNTPTHVGKTTDTGFFSDP